MARKFDVNWHTSYDPQLYAYRSYVYTLRLIDVACHERFQCNQNYWKDLTNDYEKIKLFEGSYCFPAAMN